MKTRITTALLNLLRQGATPEKLALSIAIGIGVGIFPLLGMPTLLCTIVAIALRLNLPAVQAANYSMWPLQLALMLPLARLGEKILGAKPFPVAPLQLFSMLHRDMFRTFSNLWHGILHAAAGWLIAGPVVIAIVYSVLTPLLASLARKFGPETAKAKAASA